MNEENLKNAEEIKESAEGVATPEDIAAAEDGAVTPEDAAETAAESGIYVSDEAEEAQAPEMIPGLSKKVIIGIAVGITIAAAIAVFIVTGVIGGGRYNKYNNMYVDIYGETAEEFADEQCMEFDEFLEYYGLPYDMPKDTNINAVQSLIPLHRYIELFGGGYTFDMLKEQMGWDDSITEDTTLGEALDTTLLRNYVGEEQFDAFKEQYNLGDEVTLNTTWGQIRNTVDKQNKEEYARQKAEAEAAQDEMKNSTAEDSAE